MSSASERHAYHEARDTAERLLTLLAPYCTRSAIAGSIRRATRPDVGDIELCLEALYVPSSNDLFGQPGVPVSTLDARIEALLRGGTIQHAPPINNRKAADGPRYKRILFETIACDLFLISEPASWGVEYIIRTGPWEFSKAMVTPTTKGGLMPSYLHVAGGALHHGADPVITPEEHDVFALYHLPDLRPEQRVWPLPTIIMNGLHG